MTISAFLLNMMEVVASTGRRGNIVAMQDGFTCDLVYFAEFCAYAKPFDFDIKILISELTLLVNCAEFRSLQLAMPLSTTAANSI